MYDSIELEAMGLPTAVIATREFEREALIQRLALGMPDLAPVIIDHPLSSLTDEQIDGRADQAYAQLHTVYTGRPG